MISRFRMHQVSAFKEKEKFSVVYCTQTKKWCIVSFLRDGLVAQSVEQRIENPRVGGSIPPQATKNSVVKQTLRPALTGLAFLFWVGL